MATTDRNDSIWVEQMPAGPCCGSDLYERKLSVLTVRARAAVTYDGRREVLS